MEPRQAEVGPGWVIRHSSVNILKVRLIAMEITWLRLIRAYIDPSTMPAPGATGGERETAVCHQP